MSAKHKCDCCEQPIDEPMRLNPVEYLAKVSTVTRFLCRACYTILDQNVEAIDNMVRNAVDKMVVDFVRQKKK